MSRHAGRHRDRRRWLLLAPLPAAATGALVMADAGIGAALWLQNLAAALIGIALVFTVRPRKRNRAWSAGWAAGIGLVVVAATLVAPGLDGVHRWLPLGPLRLHAAALVLPALLVVLAHLPLRTSAAAALGIAAVLLVQPDLAQALAWAMAWSTLAGMRFGRPAIPFALALLAAAAVTALRPDPLQPVPHVEEIIGLAFSMGSLIGLVALLSLVLIPAAWLTVGDRAIGAAVAACFAATIAAVGIGHFPVPVLGLGMSPILGYYLAVRAWRLHWR